VSRSLDDVRDRSRIETSLDVYRRPRLVVLRASASALDAALAMAEHHVDTVLVGERSALVGLVTARDLAIELVAAGLDANDVSLSELMSEPVHTIDVGASVDDAVRAMCEHACRRLPITEDGIAVGLVTLDDLLLDGTIEPKAARAVVIAQLDCIFPNRRGSAEPRGRERRRPEVRCGASARRP
jgi:CBS domain-containing protein